MKSNLMVVKFFPQASTFTCEEEDFYNGLLSSQQALRGGYKPLEAYALYIFIKMRIHNKQGFYMVVDDSNISALVKESNTSADFVYQVIGRCLQSSIFDREMYDQYKILTSEEIQETYAETVKRKKEISIMNSYAYASTHQFLEKCFNIVENVDKNGIIVYKKNTIQNNTKSNNTKSNEGGHAPAKPVKKTEQHEQVKISPDEMLLKYERFKQAYPDKVKDINVDDIPNYMDLDLLATKITESPDYLAKVDIDFYFLKNQYYKILENQFKTWTFKQKGSSSEFIKHEYTAEQLNSLFDDLDKVDL